MKILGQDWMDFCNELPASYYFDECDAPEEYSVQEYIQVTDGFVRLDPFDTASTQFDARLSSIKRRLDNDTPVSVLALFRKWKRMQGKESFVVQFSKDKRKEIETAIIAAGGKIV